jgi:predicted branched-subunit amino acid permease
MLGTGLALWSGWQGSTALGITLGPRIPDTWQLDFALPLTFVARLIPSLRDRPGLAAALCGAVLAVFLDGLPYRLGLISVAAI